MRFDETPTGFVVIDSPWLQWVFACVMAPVGAVFVAWAAGLIAAGPHLDVLPRLFALGLGLFGVFISAFVAIQAPLSRVDVDSAGQRVRVTRWSLTGRSEVLVHFSDIAGVDVETNLDERLRTTARPRLRLTDGTFVLLSHIFVRRQSDAERVAARVRIAVGLPG